ncbi:MULTISPECIES: PLP-dependent aminotransferase family protein [Leucobacter]|uniref:PLP-dependent aminotransferase family protein n=1 Tax=Leucobacter manosquensis TaxID=2810611 RepID=A0ABS5M1Z9_9MICO|nr:MULTISPECIES: PLP-dependent aminotransferase family protein [Leucobacter]MBS3180736.1 PLP-dependent aminotransferase family protein [Leucobacter manosquensis]
MNETWTGQRLSARRLTELLGRWRGAGHGYLELADSVTLLVRDGRIVPGTTLPAERPLAESLGVSRTTVAAAYQRLRETAVVRSRRGSGTVVRGSGTTREGLWAGTIGGIDLSSACPEPWSGLAELNARAATEHAAAFRLIGYDTLGLPELRASLAERYTARGLPTTPEQIMVTLGAQHAIFLIARTLLRRGDRSLVESPSYPHAREAIAATGALLAELPVGGGGIGSHDGYDASSMLEIAERTSPKLAYLIPDHHNPTGLRMPVGLKSRLITALAGQGAYIIADETTAELSLGEPVPIVPFAAHAEQEHHHDAILTVGSVGKTVWGGMRVGWIRAAPDLIGRLEAARRIGDLGTGTWEQVLALHALEQYDDILVERSHQLTARHRFLVERLAERVPEWTPSPAVGGVCVWVDIGERASSRLSRAAAELDLHLPPGPRFGSPGTFERFVRLPFSAPEATLDEAVDRLARAWRSGAGGAAARPFTEAVI